MCRIEYHLGTPANIGVLNFMCMSMQNQFSCGVPTDVFQNNYNN